jgi:hypothetical protein
LDKGYVRAWKNNKVEELKKLNAASAPVSPSNNQSKAITFKWGQGSIVMYQTCDPLFQQKVEELKKKNREE